MFHESSSRRAARAATVAPRPHVVWVMLCTIKRNWHAGLLEGHTQPHRAGLGDTIAWKAARPRRPKYRLGRTRRGIRNSVARSQNDVPCTTVVRHTEEPLSGARQTAGRTDLA
eukprot:scaffold14222_cov74-Phaeocystis_antarctica.AAC.1